MNDWKSWALKLQDSGPSNFYSQNYFSDYFPGYLYILWTSGSIFNFLSIPINSFQFEVFLKTVTTLFDIGSAFYIYKVVSNYNKKFAIFAPVLYLLNPAIIFNTSVWGQIDGIFTFFLILSFYFLIEKKKIYESSFTTSLGILIKPHSLAILPVLLINDFQNFSRQKFIKSLILGFLVLILMSLPFFPNNPILGIFQLGLKSQNIYPFTSLFAFNFWGIFGWWKPDSLTFVFTYKTWGIIIYTISILLIIVPLIKKKSDPKYFYLTSALSLLAFFLFPTRIHERYPFPFLAFILISAIIKKSKFLFAIYIISSIVHFINLWFVYYYYNFVYNNPKFASNIFYLFINENYKFFSILMVVSFVILLIFYYKTYAKKT